MHESSLLSNPQKYAVKWYYPLILIKFVYFNFHNPKKAPIHGIAQSCSSNLHACFLNLVLTADIGNKGGVCFSRSQINQSQVKKNVKKSYVNSCLFGFFVKVLCQIIIWLEQQSLVCVFYLENY